MYFSDVKIVDITTDFITSEIIFKKQGSLFVHYKKEYGKYKFSHLTDGKIVVTLADLWINFSAKPSEEPSKQLNGIPAEYLKGFRSKEIIPKGGICWNDSTVQFDDGTQMRRFYVQLEWKEWSTKTISIIIHYELGDQKDIQQSLQVISDLKILGLKKKIQIDIIKEDESFENYILYLDNLTLNDTYTLEQCGINNGTEIHLQFDSLSPQQDRRLQKHTGSDYSSIEEFKGFISSMFRNIHIVCQIKKGNDSGTGFLIRKNLILTATHNLVELRGKKATDEDCKGWRVVFFYEKDGQKSEEFKLDKVIYSSPTQKIGGATLMSCLDFSIVSFKLNSWNPCLFIQMYKLSTVANSFFQLEHEINWKKTRANIIQHPLGYPKKIAFRENQVKEPGHYLLHYKSETEEGSSGAPVINDHGQFIGLHISECRELDFKLFKKKKELFKKLELGKPNKKSKHGKYRDFPCHKELVFHFEGKHQGHFQESKDGELIVLTEFVEKTAPNILKKEAKEKEKDIEVKDILKGRTVSTWFYEEHLNIPASKIKDHELCNTAINAKRIYQKLKDEKIILQDQWSCDDVKPLVTSIFLLGALVSVVGLGYLYSRNSKS